MARLDQNSQNSSRPPSGDPPWKARPPRTGSGGKRGGQPGHRGHTRRQVPEAELTGWQEYYPAGCQHCGTEFADPDAGVKQPPRCHQVWELPIAAPEVTEYRRHGCTCPDCGRVTWAELPPEVPRSGQGPRLEGLLGLLTGAYRLSRRNAAQLVGEVWGLPLCAATVSRVEARLTTALAPVHAALGKALATATQIHVDETPWWEAGQRLWLWTATTAQVCYFHVDPERSREALNRLLAPFREGASDSFGCILGSDRYSAYGHWPADRHQHCLGHVDRDLAGAAARGGLGAANAACAQEDLGQIFHLWHQFQRGELDRETLQELAVPHQTSLRTALELGEMFGNPKQRGLCRTLLKEWDRLWVFLAVEGVEPTNNTAERTLRTGVIWRKTSFGSQSERGRQYVARMLSVVGTARRQGCRVLDYLTAVMRAQHAGLPAPFLPITTPP